MYKFITILLAVFLPLGILAQSPALDVELLSLIQSFSKTSAVTGREEEASAFVESLFAAGTFKKDRLGNLTITLGSGTPKRLFVTPLDEPGYVVSNILDNGYLRIMPVGYGHLGTMYHQFLEGNEVKINTEKGIRYGVAVVPSSHFDGLRADPVRSRGVYQWQEAFIDVGMASAKEAEERGIRLVDPLTANKKPQIINNEYISAPSAASKSVVIALASVAKTLMQAKFTGTVVIAFVTLELINGKGIEDVANRLGPFDQVVRFNRFLQQESGDARQLLTNRKLPFVTQNTKIVKPVIGFRHPSTGSPDWPNDNYFEVGLPSSYTNTPVEMVPISAVQGLIQTWLNAVESKSWSIESPKLPAMGKKVDTFTTYAKEEDLLAKLVSLYGVSSAEKPVRDYILSAMPTWAKPEVDAKGNIILTFGKGKQHLAFVAHMDEVGYQVDSIRADGTLLLKTKGGFFNSVWEGHAALVHTAQRDIPAAFEPRDKYLTATTQMNGNLEPTVFAGFASRQEAITAGVVEDETTVTMPKQMIRLSENKATARGFDDRVGCASLLLLLQNIKPEELPFKVTFVWSVEEEGGLVGATYAAKNLQDASIAYAIDTFVSSDDPIDPQLYAYCPLGKGAVIRVLESINFIGREHLNYLQSLAKKNGIKTQYGMTAGGTDGQAFLKYDIPAVPLSWPGRYSHSPIEIMDFRDMGELIQLIRAIITDKTKKYE
jgi:putative aminopeptidase FrvX